MNGPKWNAFLRRILDGRALFEGLWLQKVSIGPEHNRIACYSFKNIRANDSYFVTGTAYDKDAQPFSTWKSTHMFFSEDQRTVTYIWKGDRLPNATQTEGKSGVTELTLGHGGPLKLPATGEGSVDLLGEKAELRFKILRVTPRLLKEKTLGFDMEAALQDAHGEQVRLVKSFLSPTNPQPS